MSQKLLLHLDKDGSALVIESGGTEADQLYCENGPAFEDWSEDFTLYEKGTGLWIWEGTIQIDESYVTFTGELRDLNDFEWARLRRHQPIFEE